MALETWLVKKVKSALSNRHDPATKPARPPANGKHDHDRNSNGQLLAILSFEVAGLMSKLLRLWHSLSDKSLIRLHNHIRGHSDSVLDLDGVRKIISADESFLLGLVCAEMVENLRNAAASVARLSLRCHHPDLCSFLQSLEEFANTGLDRHGWVLGPKEMESLAKKMDRYIKVTASLQKEIHGLTALEISLSKAKAGKPESNCNSKVIDIQQKIQFQREEVKSLRERSLWVRSFDSITMILAQSVFTVLARIKLVFCLGGRNYPYPAKLPRSLSASAAVHPSGHHKHVHESSAGAEGFFEGNSKALRPPASTVGDAALTHHYASLIIVIEKMIRCPQLIGLDAREDLYSMLPESIRSGLRKRLSGIRMWGSDRGLAEEWNEAMGRILGWLSPLAHNTVKWQTERSLEQQKLMNKKSNGGNVLLLQTLYFANKDKTEAAITELLVGLNYAWRFEREMTAKALFDHMNKQDNHHLQHLNKT